jgi:hypothetical protein
LPARYAQPVFALLLSGLMTLVVSGITTWRTDGDVGLWLSAFASAWPVTFPTVLVVAPLVRRAVGWLTAAPADRAG